MAMKTPAELGFHGEENERYLAVFMLAVPLALDLALLPVTVPHDLCVR